MLSRRSVATIGLILLALLATAAVLILIGVSRGRNGGGGDSCVVGNDSVSEECTLHCDEQTGTSTCVRPDGSVATPASCLCDGKERCVCAAGSE